jgi:CheY-like chemotaxis protein
MQKTTTIRILVVDDNNVVLTSVCRLLTKLGYEAIAAQDGSEALRIMETNDGFNLILTDINMPQIDGWELAHRIKSIKPDIPIIALTGENPNHILPRLSGSGISYALFKPFNLDQLNNAIAYILESDWSRLSKEMAKKRAHVACSNPVRGR